MSDSFDLNISVKAPALLPRTVVGARGPTSMRNRGGGIMVGMAARGGRARLCDPMGRSAHVERHS
jgi:hypothetical protein